MSDQNLELHLVTTENEEFDVSVIFADMIKYDIMRSRLKYPSREESEFLFMGLVAYAALVRTGQLKDTKPELFLETISMIEPVGLEEDEAEFPAK